MVRIKICGIRRGSDALLAAKLGADAIGVLVGKAHPSSDFIHPEQAADILKELPPFVSGVLVSHLPEARALIHLIQRVRPQAVQLHSEIPPEEVKQLRRALPGLTVLKAVHIDGRNPLTAVAPYSGLVDGVVADSLNPHTGQVGGTGLIHDWSVTAELVERSAIPVLLAGGLSDRNVAAAIHRVQPYGVDVNSGVKAADGFKDPLLVERFIQAVRGSVDRVPPPESSDD
jgi:phosphoribosylanthranilate isomerase